MIMTIIVFRKFVRAAQSLLVNAMNNNKSQELKTESEK